MKYEIPKCLAAILSEGRPSFGEQSRQRLINLLRAECLRGGFLPKLFTLDELDQANSVLHSADRRWFLGERHPGITPGFIDVAKTVIFGQIEPESPLALDQRCTPNEVIYFGDVHHVSCWISLKIDCNEFIDIVFKRA